MIRTRISVRPQVFGLRWLSNQSKVNFQTQSILQQFKDKEPEMDAPSKMASESTLPHIQQDLNIKPKQAKKKSAFLSDSKEEAEGFEMSSIKQSLGQMVIKLFKIDMDSARAGSVAGSKYFGDCKKQGMYYPNEPLSDTAKFYYETLQLPQSFSQWFQITTLHYWMLAVRMRAMPFKYGKNYQQKLVDRIFRDMELRLAEELGITSNRLIENYLKEYHTQMLGCVLSFDEGLMTDDTTLGAAIWRNVLNGNPNVDMRHVEALVSYVRGNLYVLNQITDREFGFGKFEFVPPHQVVKPLTAAQKEALKEMAKKEFANKNLPSQKTVLSLDE
ncbi:Serine carboxypeptidase 3 [Yamadazyma tenuis]|nr:Serine carboxypeptidase 3 [Yamadazyma tenuis]